LQLHDLQQAAVKQQQQFKLNLMLFLSQQVEINLQWLKEVKTVEPWLERS
jgi:hypothetical protein